MNFRLAACCFSVGLLLCAARCASAAPLVPPGVAPGSPYHLAFVTSGTRDATNSNIADYNAFVNAQAANNPALTGTNMGVNYFAIGSTTSVDANANAVVSAPVYNLNGDLLATGFADMWDGSLNNPIRYDEFGTPGFPDVWTGTQASGVAFAGQELGADPARTGLAIVPILDGLTTQTTARWMCPRSSSPFMH